VTVLAVVIATAVLAAGLWISGRAMFEAPVLQRRNYRGVDVPVGAGMVLVMAIVATEAVLAVLDVAGRSPGAQESIGLALTLITALGFGLLGLFDDLAAHGDDKGFRGHVTAMAHGRLTTGGLKLAGGGLLAIVVVAMTGADDLGTLLVGAMVVALAANLGNLFDRAPGRTTKVGLLLGLVLLVLTGAAERSLLVGTAAVLGAALGLLVFDLREELMLGDAGANALGAALGLGVVLTSSIIVQAIVLVVLVALNAASEKVSFSRVIDRVAPLRFVDRLGRRPAD